MKILHCCLSSFYIDGYNYQENVLPRINAEDGHDVKILASTEVYIDNSKLGYTAEGSYLTEYGVPIVRLPYKKIVCNQISRRWRAYERLEDEIAAFAPDVIMFHGTCAVALLAAADYKRRHPDVKLYTDVHGDASNTAKNPLSKLVLHKLIYGFVIRKSMPMIDKVFYISMDAKELAKELYGIPEDKLEFLPLGGVIIDGEQKTSYRREIRNGLGIAENDIVLLHTGKMDRNKKTRDILIALGVVDARHLKLLIAGSFPAEGREEMLSLIGRDDRVSFLGWQDWDGLMKLLCACDVYVQPGVQSATMQNALCCGAVVMLYPWKSHEVYLKHNGWFVENPDDIEKALREIIADPAILQGMSANSYKLSRELLDYQKIAARLYCAH